MKILIIGATGGTGEALVQQALAAGHEVTAFVRDASEYHRAVAWVVEGDVLDAAKVADAVAGQDAVIDALGGSTPWKETGLEPNAAHNVVAAMRQHGVRRLVVISALGVRESQANAGFFYEHLLMPTLLRGALADKTKMEADLEAGVSDLDWVLVRPATLTNGEMTSNVQVFSADTEEKAHRISRADVAAFMLAQVTGDTYLRQAVTIATE